MSIALVLAVLAGVAVALFSALAGAGPYAMLGTSDPGVTVRVLALLVRLIVDISAAICVGSLFFCAFFTGPDGTDAIGGTDATDGSVRDGAGERPGFEQAGFWQAGFEQAGFEQAGGERAGGVTPSAYAALRTASRAAWVWAGAALLMVPVDGANSAGLPLRRVIGPSALGALIDALEGPKGWLMSAGAAVVVAVAAGYALRWFTTFILCGVSVLALLPPPATGHAASGAGHDLAMAATMLHIPAVMIWLGTLVAVLRARGLGGRRAAVLARYHRMSAGCAVVVAGTGLVQAVVLAPGRSVLSTGYGALVLAELALLVIFAAGLLPLRRRYCAAAETGDRWRGRLATAELGLLVAAMAVSVMLTHLLPPALVASEETGGELLIGYDLAGPPTPLRLAIDWRISVFFAPVSLALAVIYLLSTRRLRRGGGRWPVARTAAWLAGCSVLLLATSSGLGRYASAMFSLSMVRHALVGLLAPTLLVLGAPLTLARKLPRPGALAGPREWVQALTESKMVRRLTQPVVAAGVYAVAPFAYLFSPLFELNVRYHWAHIGVHVAFLVIGYIFAWVVVGSDPLPRSNSYLARLGLLIAVMPAGILLAVAIINGGRVLGDGRASANLYTALALPWVSDLSADQRLGGYLMLAIAEAVMLGMLLILIVRWGRANEDVDGYAALLDEITRRRGPFEVGSSEWAEAAQPQAVEYHEQRRGGHGRAGDERVEQGRGGDG